MTKDPPGQEANVSRKGDNMVLLLPRCLVVLLSKRCHVLWKTVLVSKRCDFFESLALPHPHDGVHEKKSRRLLLAFHFMVDADSPVPFFRDSTSHANFINTTKKKLPC